ncbi:MAG TPA: ABC transporter permease [Spirillospora sp.]
MTGMIDALAAEWLKLRTVRSTHWVLAATAALLAVVLLLAVQFVRQWDELPAERQAEVGLLPLQQMGGWVAALCLAVLGVLSVTAEYRTGTIRTTFTALPRRRTVLAAKAAVVGTVALVAGEVMAVGSFLGMRLVAGDRPMPDQQAPVAHDLPGYVVFGTSGAMFALLGLGLGALLRSTAGALVAIVMLWYVVPMAAVFIPEPWGERVGSVMPGALPVQAGGLDANDATMFVNVLPAGAAAVLMAVYAFGPLGLAAFLLTRRDA